MKKNKTNIYLESYVKQYVKYYDSGKLSEKPNLESLISICIAHNSIFTGLYELFFDSNNKLHATGNYIKGKPIGVFKRYSQRGKLKEICFCI